MHESDVAELRAREKAAGMAQAPGRTAAPAARPHAAYAGITPLDTVSAKKKRKQLEKLAKQQAAKQKKEAKRKAKEDKAERARLRAQQTAKLKAMEKASKEGARRRQKEIALLKKLDPQVGAACVCLPPVCHRVSGARASYCFCGHANSVR